jgi:hypothetical protein
VALAGRGRRFEREANVSAVAARDSPSTNISTDCGVKQEWQGSGCFVRASGALMWSGCRRDFTLWLSFFSLAKMVRTSRIDRLCGW